MDNLCDKIMVGILSMCNHSMTQYCIDSCIDSGIKDVFVYCNATKLNFDPKIHHELSGSNSGVSFGWNRIIEKFLKSDKEYLFICNDDIIFLKDWHHCTRHLNLPYVGMVSPLLIEKKELQPSGVSNLIRKYSSTCLFGCFGLTRNLIEKVGMFDEEFKCCGEDSDYKQRMYNYSIENDVPQIMVTDHSCYVIHYGGQSLLSSYEETTKMSQNSLIHFDKKHPNYQNKDMTRYNYYFDLFLKEQLNG